MYFDVELVKQDLNNLFGVDVKEFNSECPNVYDNVVKKCQNKGVNCCISTCSETCKGKDSKCEPDCAESCESKCNDIISQAQIPINRQSIYCECIKKYCNDDTITNLNQVRNEIVDCCESKAENSNCGALINSYICPDCKQNKPLSKPEPSPKPLGNDDKDSNQLTTIQKIGLVLGILTPIILLIIIIYKLSS